MLDGPAVQIVPVETDRVVLPAASTIVLDRERARQGHEPALPVAALLQNVGCGTAIREHGATKQPMQPDHVHLLSEFPEELMAIQPVPQIHAESSTGRHKPDCGNPVVS